MPLCLRNVLTRCRPHIETTLLGHEGDMKIRLEMASQGLIPLGVEICP
jgi:hypothetical protein